MSKLVNLNATTPAAAAGTVNLAWQESASSTGIDPASGLPIYPASVAVPIATASVQGIVKPDAATILVTAGEISVPIMVGDTGSGGVAGLAPAPGAGDAAAGKYLKADGTYAVPPGTGPAGTVTSVALSVPTDIFSVSGSPVTSSGTLAISKATQTANTVFAGPTSGASAAPTFRALVAADVPGKPSVTFSIANGSAVSPAAPYVLAPVAGPVSNCYFTTLASDGATNLVFNLKKNGTSILSGSSATVSAATSPGTVSTFSLTSGTISVSQGDKWELDITTGTAAWQGTVQCY